MSLIVLMFFDDVPDAGPTPVMSRAAPGPTRVSRALMPPCGPKLDMRACPVLRLLPPLSGMGRLQSSVVVTSRPSHVVPTRTGLKCPSSSALDTRLCVGASPPSWPDPGITCHTIGRDSFPAARPNLEHPATPGSGDGSTGLRVCPPEGRDPLHCTSYAGKHSPSPGLEERPENVRL